MKKSKASDKAAIRLLDYPTPADYAPMLRKPEWMRPFHASENPCATCPGHCCELELSLTVHDVARLALTLELDPREFCSLAEPKEAWRSPPVKIDGAQRYLALKSGVTRPCIFLHRLETQRRCAVYQLRPMTCRLDPFRWERDGQVEGAKAIWCPSEWLLAPAARRCVSADIRRAHQEELESKRALRAFGRQKRFPATQEGFLRYVLFKGGALLGLDPEPMLARAAPRRLGERLW